MYALFISRLKLILFFCRRIYLYNFFITLIFLTFFFAFTFLENHLLISNPGELIGTLIFLFIANSVFGGFYASLLVFHNFNRGEWMFYFNKKLTKAHLVLISQAIYIVLGSILFLLMRALSGVLL